METILLEEIATDVRLPITKEQFLNWSPDNGLLFEFDNGFAEPTTGMKKEERYLVRNIQRAFRKTVSFAQDAMLLEETDVWLTNHQKRIPDIAFFTNRQINDSATGSDEPVPMFVVEIISPTDKTDKVERKVLEYFQAGVQIIWHIYPALNMVRVISSPRLASSFFDDDAFSAAPVLPDLQLTVSDLFRVE